jgi:hypothetical protein
MISICHSEDALFASEESAVCHPEGALFAGDQFARLAHIRMNYDSFKGGKSGAKCGQSRAIRAVYPTFGSVSHRLLVNQLLFPTNLTDLTTFNHFLPHLSRKLLIVKQKLEGRSPTRRSILENTESCGLPIE